MKTTTIDTAQKHLAEQREWVKKRHLDEQAAVAARDGGRSGLVDEKMLAESMRSVRYSDEAHAAGDLVDNSIEAGASQVHTVYNTDGNSVKQIAFIDDASGIDRSFLPHATKWGGSSYDGRRNTFGRFGFGLPSASVNRGRKFDVYSRTEHSQDFYAVTLDLDNLESTGGTVQLPEVEDRPVPDWIQEYAESETPDGKPMFRGGLDAVRTVVVWTNLDKLEWSKIAQSASRFKEHYGVTYASWLGVVDLVVNGEPVEPVDVLFTTPGYRWYDIDGYPKAEPQDSIKFNVADDDGVDHEVIVRFSYLSVPAYDAEAQPAGRGRPTKIRKRIRKDYNGFFVTRNGRFIELAKPSFLTWNNYARQVGVAIDFPPELDELFGVTPDKQSIIFTDRLEQLLKSHGVERAFKALVNQVDDERRRRKAERDKEIVEGDEKRPSEEAIAKVVEMDVRRSRKASKESQEEAQKNLKEKAKELAEKTGVPEEEIVKAQEKKHAEKPYRVEFERQTVDDPFYSPYMEGTQLVLRINTGHPWYRELYGRLKAEDAEFRSGLELMLWVLATSEIDATGDNRIFYRSERVEWSRRMADAFDLHPLVFNKVSSREELEDDDPEAWAEDEDDEVEEATVSG